MFTINEMEYLRESIEERLEDVKSQYERSVMIMSRIGCEVSDMRDEIVSLEGILGKLGKGE